MTYDEHLLALEKANQLADEIDIFIEEYTEFCLTRMWDYAFAIVQSRYASKKWVEDNLIQSDKSRRNVGVLKHLCFRQIPGYLPTSKFRELLVECGFKLTKNGRYVYANFRRMQG